MKTPFKKFVSAYSFRWLILPVVTAILIVAFIISAIAGNDVQYVGLIIFIALFAVGLIPLIKSKKFYADIESKGMLPYIEADFEKAFPVRNNIYLGNNWIYVKGKERLLSYADITQVYQYIHKTNFVENERALKYVDKNGKHRVLCKIDLRGKSDEDVRKIVSFILSKNPNIKIGFH